MSVTVIGLDLAKSVFQLHGVDADGCAVLKRRIRRQGLLAFFEQLPPCLVGMEACSSAHHWARELVALGHDVRLTPRMSASGNREYIGRISKGGDRYLRTLLIHGARAMVGTSFRRGVRPRPWLQALIARRPVNVAAVAVAHKTARALWAMIRREEAYRHPAVFEAAA